MKSAEAVSRASKMDALWHIFSRLDAVSLRMTSLVSKDWHAASLWCRMSSARSLATIGHDILSSVSEITRLTREGKPQTATDIIASCGEEWDVSDEDALTLLALLLPEDAMCSLHAWENEAYPVVIEKALALRKEDDLYYTLDAIIIAGTKYYRGNEEEGVTEQELDEYILSEYGKPHACEGNTERLLSAIKDSACILPASKMLRQHPSFLPA